MNKNKFINLEKKTLMICILILLSITFCVFLYTVKIRQPWFNTLSYGHHQWLTGSTIKFTKMWLSEGPINLKFGMFENPSSIEFPTLNSRLFYSSYPPGTILPIYIICKWLRLEPTPGLINSYNLLNHFLIAFFLSLTLFIFLLQIEFNILTSLILSLIPIFIELLMPAPLYWHQNVFFTDQAVILPFVLVIFLEVLKDGLKNKKIFFLVNCLQTIVFFYGYLTDWFFCFVGLIIYLKRVLNGEIKGRIFNFIIKSFFFWIPLIIVLSLFALQLSILNGWNYFIGRYFFRTRLGPDEAGISKFFEYLADGYGSLSIYLLWVSLLASLFFLIYLCIKKYKKEPVHFKILKSLSFIAILLLPCFMQIYFLKQHTVVHDFSALKFSIPLSIVPFILLPIIVLHFIFDIEKDLILNLQITYKNRDKIIKIPLCILLTIIIVFTYIKSNHYKYINYFPEPTAYEKEQFIADNTGYEDVVFSPDYEIKANPPQQLSYSMKRVYKFNAIKDVYELIKNIKDSYTVNFFLIKEQISNNDAELHKLVLLANDIRENEKYILYKISKANFWKGTDPQKLSTKYK